MPAFAPGPADLEAYAGLYASEEIDMTYRAAVENGKLVLRFRPAQRLELAPVYADAFESRGSVIRFTRNASGAIDGFRIFAGRVRHLRFVRKS